MSTTNKKITPDSLYYKIIQEIKDKSSKLGLSQEDVATGIGVSFFQGTKDFIFSGDVFQMEINNLVNKKEQHFF